MIFVTVLSVGVSFDKRRPIAAGLFTIGEYLGCKGLFLRSAGDTVKFVRYESNRVAPIGAGAFYFEQAWMRYLFLFVVLRRRGGPRNVHCGAGGIGP